MYSKVNQLYLYPLFLRVLSQGHYRVLSRVPCAIRACGLSHFNCVWHFATAMDYSLPGSSCPWDFPGKNTGVGCHALALLQGIFPTQGSNLGVPHCSQILYHWATREYSNVCTSIIISQFIPHFPLGNHVCFLHLWLYSCFVNKFTCVIFYI